ncbi:dockerin type I domain-containing protein [Lacipirellula sp.]|uniref:dockerin type I domain-containing protein n=1 Tax=Lacipirellula sp. TaxID=2691419 RepID=UPI003D0BD2D0
MPRRTAAARFVKVGGAARPPFAPWLLRAFLAVAFCGDFSLKPAAAITIQFDYTHDQGIGFFGTAENPTLARTTLEFAAKTFTSFTDTLAAIEPGGGNRWNALYVDPLTNTYKSTVDLTVPQNTLIVYAMPLDLAGQTLGQASPGTRSFIGTPTAAFSAAVTNRNQGNSSVDFAPWGGMIAVDMFDSSGVARNWHFDVNTPPSPDEYDFYTVVTHELAHMLGFGTSAAFSADVLNGTFIGAYSQTLYNGVVPLSGGQHWASDVTSPPYLPGTQPRPSLGPTLPRGERRLFTPLDYAALADVGWQVPAKLYQLPGDFNGDHIVDGADFLVWQRNFGKSGILPADANVDGVVDAYDAWIMQQNYGAMGAQFPLDAVAGTSVPEPTSVALTLSAAAVLFGCMRRRKSQSIMNDVMAASCTHVNAT